MNYRINILRYQLLTITYGMTVTACWYGIPFSVNFILLWRLKFASLLWMSMPRYHHYTVHKKYIEGLLSRICLQL